MGLSLARLLDAETAYIQLTRSLLADPGTTFAQQVDNLRRSLQRRFPQQEDLILLLERAVELFARGELEMGLQEFSTAVRSLPMDQLPSHCRQIFAEGVTRMQEFGFERTEYIILVNLVLEKY
jgi:hypothetical protein